jgi:hypothetical protein
MFNIFPDEVIHVSDFSILHTYPPMKMEQTEFSETSPYKIQMPGNYPEESIQQVTNYLHISVVINSSMFEKFLPLDVSAV